MKWKKVLALGMATVITLGIVAGCRGKNENSNAKNNSNGSKVKVTLSTWAGAREADEIDELLAKLNDSQDAYEIVQQVIPNDYYMKIQTQIAGKQAPDLMWLSQEYVPVYASKGSILQLDDLMADNNELLDDFLPGPLATAKYEGKLYGLPWIGQPYVVYYNKNMFEEKGVDEPTLDWTWDTFYDTAKTLTDDEVYGFATTGNPPLEVFEWGFGGETIDENGDIQITNAETVEGLEYAYNMINDNTAVMPYLEATSMNVEDAFISGKTAMMVGGAADDIEKKVAEAGGAFEVGMAVMPAGPKNHVTFSWTASTVINSQTENPEVVQQALIDLTKATFDYKIPAPIASKIDKVSEINPDKEYAMDVIQKSCEIARGFNNQPQQNEIAGYLWEELTLPIYSDADGKGNVDIEALVNNAKEEIEEIMSE